MTNQNKKIATVQKKCGLSNRIKTIISYLRLYEEIHTVVEADSYIFPEIKLANESINPITDWRLYVFPEEEQYIEKYKTIDFLYEKTPQYFIDLYTKIFQSLKINTDIVNYVNDFTEQWNSDILGVHIRTWHSDYSRNTWHSNSLFEKEIDKFPSDKKIFLCSDNPQTIEYFKNKYSERIITYPQRLHEKPLGSINIFDQYQNDVQLVADGFIDCLLLSKCNTIIGTFCSTFTEVAWWFSGCKAKVIIPEPLNYDSNYNDHLFLRKDG